MRLRKMRYIGSIKAELRMEVTKMSKFKFSVGPWNVHTGADSYGPETRKEIPFEEKVKKFAEMGFSAI